jgi:hypothetical protein
MRFAVPRPIRPPANPVVPPARRWRHWTRIHERIVLSALITLLLLTLALARPWRTHILPLAPSTTTVPHDWSAHAYVTHATDAPTLCSSLMLLEALHRLGSRPARLLLYPSLWDVPGPDAPVHLLRQARDRYGATLEPVDVAAVAEPAPAPQDPASWTTLLALNQTRYRRVVALHADASLLQPLDELFLLPPAVHVAMPRVYWRGGEGKEEAGARLTSAVVLLEPSAAAWAAVEAGVRGRGVDDWDVEVVDRVFGGAATVLPHREYGLRSGEFRAEDHGGFLGESGGGWDARRALREAKLVLFRDGPVPKPWVGMSRETMDAVRPSCGGLETCGEREVWEWLYGDFRERRKRVCGMHTAVENDNVENAEVMQDQERMKYEMDHAAAVDLM